jgi:hypothetical protein
MTDPRDFDRRMDIERHAEMERTTGTSTPWGWIAAAVFVIVILALVFAGGENTRTAREDASPPATTRHGAKDHAADGRRSSGTAAGDKRAERAIAATVFRVGTPARQAGVPAFCRDAQSRGSCN